jgi:hypothetical protein
LIYHLPEKPESAMRKAVEKVVEIAAWDSELPKGIQTIIL